VYKTLGVVCQERKYNKIWWLELMFSARAAIAMFFEPDLKNLPELSDTLKKSVSITFTANDGMS
jgi:hypothetical protein